MAKPSAGLLYPPEIHTDSKIHTAVVAGAAATGRREGMGTERVVRKSFQRVMRKLLWMIDIFFILMQVMVSMHILI